MARTWSNAKKTETISAAQRARMGRPSGLTAFSVFLVLGSIFFMAIIIGIVVQVLVHPVPEVTMPANQQPKDD